MFIADLKKLSIALLLLAFISQTLAMAVMSCQLGNTSPSPVKDMGAMDHSESAMTHMHHMDDMSADDMALMHHQTNSDKYANHFDCCKIMGHCLFGGCSFVAVDNNLSFSLPISKSYAVDFYSDQTPAPLVSSLYRPPISF